MTLQRLNEYLQLNELLINNQELLQSLEKASFPKSPIMNGMPHTTGVHDRTGELAAEIADLRDDIADTQTQMEEMRVEISAFIRSIKDAEIRNIIRLRFIHGLSWKEVAGMMGKYKTTDGIKSKFYRYMNTNEVEKRAVSG